MEVKTNALQTDLLMRNIDCDWHADHILIMVMVIMMSIIRECMIDHLEIMRTVFEEKNIIFENQLINKMVKMTTIREWMIDHLEIESTVLHKESEEGKAQMQREGANKMGEHHDHDKGDDENRDADNGDGNDKDDPGDKKFS